MADGCQHPKPKEVRTGELSGPQRSHGRGTAPQSSSRRGRQPPPGPQQHGKEKQREIAQPLSAPILHLILVLPLAMPRPQPEASAAPRGPFLGYRSEQRRQSFAWQVGGLGDKQRLASYSGSLPIAPLFHPPPPGLRRL